MNVIAKLKTLTYWDQLSKLSKNRIVKSSYFWLAFVPLMAKILNKIETPLSILFDGGYLLTIEIGLPFNWKIFFLSALLISLANLVYWFFCPKLIQEFKDFSDFQQSGREIDNLDLYIPKENEELLKDLNDSSLALESAIRNMQDTLYKVEFGMKGLLSSMFWKIFETLKEKNIIARIICYLLYLAGIILFIIVFVQNALYVLKHFV